MKDTCDCCNHHGNRDPGYLPKRTNSSDSISHGIHGPQFLPEDMGEDAGLRKTKTANSISISPEVSLMLSCMASSMANASVAFREVVSQPSKPGQGRTKENLCQSYAHRPDRLHHRFGSSIMRSNGRKPCRTISGFVSDILYRASVVQVEGYRPEPPVWDLTGSLEER